MYKTKIAKTVMAVVVGSALVGGSALAAEEGMIDKSRSTADTTGQKIDSSIKKVSGFMDDSSITAKVKAALADDKAIKSTDISVTTESGAVTLNGFVASQEQAEAAVSLAEKVEGVKSVHDKLHTKDKASQSAGNYVDDTAITSKVKATLLTETGISSSSIAVETNDGVVQLSGTVKNQEQSDRSETVAKEVKGVKSVKNDLQVKP